MNWMMGMMRTTRGDGAKMDGVLWGLAGTISTAVHASPPRLSSPLWKHVFMLVSVGVFEGRSPGAFEISKVFCDGERMEERELLFQREEIATSQQPVQ